MRRSSVSKLNAMPCGRRSSPGLSRCTSSDAAGTRGCCCRRVTSGASPRPRGRSPPWRRAIRSGFAATNSSWPSSMPPSRRLRLGRRRSTARRAKAALARAAAEQAIVAQDALVREIDHRRDLNAQLTGELQDAQQKLEGTLARRRCVDRARLALPIGPFRGALPWPTDGQAQRRGEAVSSSAIAQRPGSEIVAAQGTPVHAIYDGRGRVRRQLRRPRQSGHRRPRRADVHACTDI